jgi:hypothetical protein
MEHALPDKSSAVIPLAIGLGLGFLLIAISVLLFFYWRHRRRKQHSGIAKKKYGFADFLSSSTHSAAGP